MAQMVPLRELVPPNHTDAQCRQVLRSSGQFQPVNGRWVFPKRQAKQVKNFLATH